MDDQAIVGRYLGTRGINADATPEAVLVAGPPATGKTRWRREHLSNHAPIDAGDLFWFLGASVDDDFPGPWEDTLQRIGRLVAETALRERRNVVIELLGGEDSPVKAVVASLRAAGYRTRMIAMVCDVEVAMARNVARGADNISCYFAEGLHAGWVLDAAP
ncbi:MAG: hypothetical protein IPK27_05640 [Rhodanobacteraceae bacterium]|nr:hypothetical protein [Rhodanobacteraceae bacterium]